MKQKVSSQRRPKIRGEKQQKFAVVDRPLNAANGVAKYHRKVGKGNIEAFRDEHMGRIEYRRACIRTLAYNELRLRKLLAVTFV